MTNKVLSMLKDALVKVGLGADTNGMHILDLLNKLFLRQRSLEELDLVALLVENLNGGSVDVFKQKNLDITSGERFQNLGMSTRVNGLTIGRARREVVDRRGRDGNSVGERLRKIANILGLGHGYGLIRRR